MDLLLNTILVVLFAIFHTLEHNPLNKLNSAANIYCIKQTIMGKLKKKSNEIGKLIYSTKTSILSPSIISPLYYFTLYYFSLYYFTSLLSHLSIISPLYYFSIYYFISLLLNLPSPSFPILIR